MGPVYPYMSFKECFEVFSRTLKSPFFFEEKGEVYILTSKGFFIKIENKLKILIKMLQK